MKPAESVPFDFSSARIDATAVERAAARCLQQLKDRRDLRAALLERRAQLDAKIEKVEAEIRKLKG